MNTDICSIIASYIIEEKYEILEWININRLHIELLSFNKYSIHYLEKDINNINWSKISGNKNAIYLLKENLDKINWDLLSFNSNAITILNQNKNE